MSCDVHLIPIEPFLSIALYLTIQNRHPGGIPPPSQEVYQLENALIKTAVLPSTLSKLNLKENYPRRPAFGTKGAPVQLLANYFELAVDRNLVLYRYDHQDISPSVTGKKLVQVIRLLLESPQLTPFKGRVATDFRSTLISREKLPIESEVITIQYRNEGEDTPPEKPKEYKVTVQHTGTFPISDLLDNLKSTDVNAEYNAAPLIQAFNIFLNHYGRINQSLVAIGSSKKFSIANVGGSQAGYSLGGGLEALRGFYSSIRLGTGRLLVNVNVSNGAFYQSGPLKALVDQYGQENVFRLEKFLKKLRIRTTHLPVRKNKKGEEIVRPKTIQGLAGRSDGGELEKGKQPLVETNGAGPHKVRFFWDDKPGGAGYISVQDFFARKYRIKTDQKYPVINVGTRGRPSYLPVETCEVLSGQPSTAKLTGDQTAKMIGFAVRRPHQNADSILQDGFDTVGLSSQNALLQTFKMAAIHKLITVQGRVLQAPQLLYGTRPMVPKFGSWNMQGLKFSAHSELPTWSWAILNFPGNKGFSRLNETAQVEVFKEVHRKLNEYGVKAAIPARGGAIDVRSDSDPAIENAFSRSKANGVKLLLVILPDNMTIYKHIKYLGDVKYGILTVCVVGSKLSNPKGQDMYIANVALKFNLKLGGRNQQVHKDRLGLLQEGKTMVVGIDVTHPSPGSSFNAPSVAGIVASIDALLGQWPATLRVQKSRTEMVEDLQDMLESRLDLWRTKNGRLPENILIYRDGVSEGQYSLVMEKEFPLIQKACMKKYKNMPKFTVVICGKRHHTRFFPTEVSKMDRSGNCQPGTVVDRGVTEARTWDFFLQAHSALQGTARPCHYVVIHDEIFRARAKANTNVADALEDVTQSLCYTFGRATKAVSLCTPAYYADLVCERARCYLADVFDATPEGSVAGSSQTSTQSNVQQMRSKVKIHDHIKNTMFYI